jgi:hypothetical protein
MYALHRLHSNNDNEVIPDVGVRNVLPTRYPSGLDLTATVTESVAEKGYLTLALAGLLGIPLISTTEELRTLGEDVSAQYYGHYLLSRLPHGELDRSALWDTLQSIYVNTTCSLVPSGTTWEAWLTNLEFPSELFTEEEYLLLITNILNIVVGIDIGSVSLSNKHTALIEILKLLTSYGIIFSDGTKDKPGMVYDYPWIFPVGYAYGHSEAHTLLSGVDGLGVKDSVAVSTKLSNSDIILTRIPVHKQSYRLVMSDLALTYVCGDTCTYKLDLGNLESGPVTTTVIEDV